MLYSECTNRTVCTTGNQTVTGFAPSDTGHRCCVSRQLCQLCTGGQIENAQHFLFASGRKEFAIRTEGNTLYRPLTIVEDAKQFAAGHTPETNRQIGGTSGQVISIRMKSDGLRMIWKNIRSVRAAKANFPETNRCYSRRRPACAQHTFVAETHVRCTTDALSSRANRWQDTARLDSRSNTISHNCGRDRRLHSRMAATHAFHGPWRHCTADAADDARNGLP